MSLASVFDLLGQTVLPQVASTAFPDTMDIKAKALTASSSGERIKGAATTAYEAVPCTYKAEGVRTLAAASGDKIVSVRYYTVKLPTHHQGERINLDPKTHSFTVLERGNEPEKVFEIVSIGDQQGVIYEVTCTKEN